MPWLRSLVKAIIQSQASAEDQTVAADSNEDGEAPPESSTSATVTSHQNHTGPIVWEEEEEKSPFKRNPNLNMDRMKTQSLGGLGRAENEKKEAGCCGGCVVV